LTTVMTAWRRLMEATASARWAGSSASRGGGRLMVPTAQKRQPRVHSCPAIMKVASPLAQHSWMFGHRASSQTVCSLLSLTADFVRLNAACCSPVGRLVRNQSGRRRRGAEGLLLEAMGRGFPTIVAPPFSSPKCCCPKKVCRLAHEARLQNRIRAFMSWPSLSGP
jgi:hypothetical protein